jgi:hypothetical protein
MSIEQLVEWCVEAAVYREPLHPSGMMLTYDGGLRESPFGIQFEKRDVCRMMRVVKIENRETTQCGNWLTATKPNLLTHELCELIAADPAWSKILSPSNVLAHPRRNKSPNSTSRLIAVGWSVVFA